MAGDAVGAAPGGPAVLVTGGAGYIGSHAAAALAEGGFTPVVYDDFSRGFREFVRFGPVEEGDIRDGVRLREAIARHRPAAILHFAAVASVEESTREPALYYDVNVGGALRVIEAARAEGVEKIVFSSTCAIYGTPAQQPISEDTPPAPINPYGRSKLMVERILADVSTAQGLRYVALRYFNACGAHPSGLIGENHDPEPHLIPRALMAAAGDIDGIDLFGTDYPTPDGAAVRDYIHVCDLADAHVLALRYLLAGGESIALNLGAGRGYSVREIIAAVNRVVGREIPVRLGPRRAGDPPVLTADVSAARRVLGFEAKWLDIDEIIRTAWRWHQRDQREAAAG